MKKKHKTKTKNQILKEKCDNLYRQIIYLRAGNKSELSGKKGILHAHHFRNKKTYALRYDLRNGICLLIDEHLFGVHSTNFEKAKRYNEMILSILKKREGENIEEILIMQKNNLNADLKIIKIYLELKLKELKNE